jgi:OPA family glycerol-3-phosphate transporter-like MFS transporter 1/2
VKQQLQNTAGYSSIILSAMDTVFMGTYAAGNIISGNLGDTFNPTTILVIGLLGNGVCLFLIAVSLWLDIQSMCVTIGNIFIITIYFLFGFFQSVGDPVGERSHGMVFLLVFAHFFTQ